MTSTKVFLAVTGRGLSRASCSNGQWKVEFRLNDQDLDIRCLAADPAHPQIVYAGTQGQGVMRSDDGGFSWQPAGLAGLIIKSLAVNGISGHINNEPGAVFAGTKSPASIFKSVDSGKNWIELESFRRIRSRWFWFSPAEPPFTAYVQGIALAPDNPNLIVAGIEAGAVVRSEDGGNTWSDHRPGAQRDCHSITFHCQQGNWAYEAGGGGPAVSRDGGKTWRQPTDGLDRHYCWAVAADSTRPEVWYISASTGPFKAHGNKNAQAFIFRSAAGASWQKLEGGLPTPLSHMPYALLTDPALPGHLYAGLSNGDVWFSPDYGDRWEQLPFNMGSIQRMMIMA